MAKTNGHANGHRLPVETATFRIGGEDVQVPAMYFKDYKAVKEWIDALGPAIPWEEYADYVMKIIAHQLAATRPELTYEEINDRLLAFEAQQLIGAMNELLRVSGFRFPEPATVPEENLGTGTSTPSAPSSPSAASAAGTPSS